MGGGYRTVGTYQVTSVLGEGEYSHFMFITVINTTTGEIVRLKKTMLVHYD